MDASDGAVCALESAKNRMSNTRVSQGHKIAIAAGSQVPAKASQAHKIAIAAGGQVPARASQAHKIVLFLPSDEPDPSPTRRRGFMSFVP